MGTLDAIVNPASANGRTGRQWPALRDRLVERGFDLRTHLTGARGDATDIAGRLTENGVAEIVVVGGDGTLNEVANGLLGCRDHGRRPVLSLIPAGTGRDVARSLGIRSQDEALALVGNGPARQLDAGAIHYHDDHEECVRFFVGFADVGLGAETAARLNRSSKRLGGFVSYLVGAGRTIATFRGHEAHVTVDGHTVRDGRVGMVVLANGRYLAGGMDMAPMASMCDGLFEVLVLRDVPKRVLLGSLLPRVYLGKHIGHPAVEHFRGRAVEVHSPEPILFQSDGEQPGTTDVRAEILPGALLIRAPGARDVTRT